MMENNKFRVALVGCGTIAPIHVPAILAAAGEVVALCDVDTSKARVLAEKFALHDAQIFADYDEMLETVKPDVVHICTPHYLHVPMAVKALRKNINVLCEKPLAINVEQLREVLATAKESKAMMGVCLQNRFLPNNLYAKKLCDEKGVKCAFGDVVWNRGEDYYRSGEWRGKWATEGGGVMINQALHTLDLLMWMCGMPEKVTAHCFNDCHKDVIEVEDIAAAKFEGGADFEIFATTSSVADFTAHIKVKLNENTVIHTDNTLLTVGDKQVVLEELEKTNGKSVWGEGHKVLIKNYYDCLDTGEKFMPDAEEASKVIRLILGMYESDGQKIEVPAL